MLEYENRGKCRVSIYYFCNPKHLKKGVRSLFFYHMGHNQVSIFERLGHYLGHYNYLAEVSITILGCGYPALAQIICVLSY